MERITELQTELNDLDPAIRARALRELVRLDQEGLVQLQPETGWVNMHVHTFFSFNAYRHSPTSLAWLARRHGFRLMGIVDFDVLKGVDEFMEASERLGVRGCAGIETRVFIPEVANQVINSPGEPGVCYHMGIGFTSSRVPRSVAGILADLEERAAQRNLGIVSRVNSYLDPVAIDYENDVLPLTPAGNPTERHIVTAYVRSAGDTVADPTAFWASKLGETVTSMSEKMEDPAAFQNLIRSRLMKRGGVGYVQPESGMFPSLEAFHKLVIASGALPCGAWLDGTTEAEQSVEDWLGFLVGKGVVALNIIPDRNWNIADPNVRSRKVSNLHRVVQVAQEMDLPLNIGTEMNSFGQKLVDDFEAEELVPVRQAFIDGAHFVYGHTMLQLALDLGYQSAWARVNLPSRRERNAFYTRLGRRVPPGEQGLARLRKLDAPPPPSQILAAFD